MKIKIIIVGAFHEIIELASASNYEILGLIDNHKTGYFSDYKILCTDENVITLDPSFKRIPAYFNPG
ncbi:MAG: hypothetical protein IPJ23_05950 [Ignavibacteriales bacterium]|nr:hypothetical protein [Ignavibacteriales bacterium]